MTAISVAGATSMSRRLAVVLTGLAMVLACQSKAGAQQVAPASYEDLVSRLQAVESQLANQNNGPVYPDAGGGCGCAVATDCCQPCCDPCCVRGGFYAMYENVWLKPHFNHNE